ncbi:Restriction endonuclease [Salegentibacter echinorum]|uniref:Restriction endonuclease n=1 Tax=Salegentibacter echinorum TaxID=1073325 RepID=A0A1M5FQW6_SALEC|nr:restriction endonuclease [Salegentibacter echinorum]SHF93903.1 Restriction endonuclease [Salegentibacter echinorum]
MVITRKKTLASSTLFPTEQSEVKPDEIFQDIFQSGNKKNPIKPLSIYDVDNLNPRLFEAFVAALYAKQGYQVYLTPFANDKGVDIVALNSQNNYLIQAKQSQSTVSNDAIQEVFTSKNYYSSHFSEDFQMTVLTNNKFGGSAKTLATSTNVELLDKDNLHSLLNEFPVSIKEVHQHEAQRLKRI